MCDFNCPEAGFPGVTDSSAMRVEFVSTGIQKVTKQALDPGSAPFGLVREASPLETVYDPNNIFARILRGEIPSKKVMETPHTLSFHDAFPKAVVHVLVIPKKPYVTFHDFISRAETEEILDFYKTADAIIRAHNLDVAGYKLQINTGEGGGQEIPHFHMHLMG